MILRKLVFAALRTAASNPKVRKQASKLAQRGLQAAKPSLMQPAGGPVRLSGQHLTSCLRVFANSRLVVMEQMMWPSQQTKEMAQLHS